MDSVNRPFLSLRWKLVATLASILIVILLLLAGFSYSNLQRQYFEFQASNRDVIFDQMQKLIHDRFTGLNQAAHLLSIEAPASSDGQTEILSQKLAEQISAIEFSGAAESVQLYDHEHHLLFDWNGSPGQQVDTMIGQAIQTEEPVNHVVCDETCLLTSAVPVLSSRSNKYIMLLSRSIADVILAFSAINDADAALITAQNKDSAEPASRVIPDWSYQVPLVTNPQTIYPLILTVSWQTTLDSLKQNSLLFASGDQNFEINVVPLPTTPDNPAAFVVVKDVTRYIRQMDNAWKGNIGISLIGIVITVLAALILLWRPVKRLHATSRSLPMLAQGAYSESRNLLNRDASSHFQDELDIVSNTATELSFELEALTTELRNNAREIEHQNIQLTHERDFINLLFNTAEVLIVTHDAGGNITRINRTAKLLAGFSTSQNVLTYPFAELFLQTPEQPTWLTQMYTAGIKDYRHDCTFITPDHREYVISWIHRLLDSQAHNQRQILSIGIDITERDQAQKQVSWLADHDPLTGLYNRRKFQEEFQSILNSAIRYRHTGAILFVDLNQFKLINDTSGHLVGDELLQKFALLLQESIRSTDLAGRIGGDEFAIVLPETNKTDTRHFAEKFIQRIQRISVNCDDRIHRISVSLGIALFPQNGTSLPDLMACADIAMYQAKRLRHEGWYFYKDEGAREKLKDDQVWKQRIEHAIETDAFVLHFQPIYKVGEKHATRYEVLIRMLNPDGSLVSPGIFIPLAEQLGLIADIDKIMLTKAVTKLSKVISIQPDVTFFVNISGSNLGDPTIISFLETLIRNHPDLDPDRLTIELTETAAIADFDRANLFIRRIKELGCNFALDDFGVGFTSFFYLKNMPVDIVKIDGSYIRQIVRSNEDLVLVKALSDMAHALGKQVIAEYVESQEICDILADFNIHYLQGFHLGRPEAELSDFRQHPRND